jgi:hypothetical protein
MTAVDSSALFMRSTDMTPADEENTPMSGASRPALWLIRLQCSCHPRETFFYATLLNVNVLKEKRHPAAQAGASNKGWRIHVTTSKVRLTAYHAIFA